jgi:hypothetical protein
VRPIMLLAAVLVAEGVSFVLVGSAALYLHGEQIPVADIDAVPDPDERNIAALREALGVLAVHDEVPSLLSLATADVVSTRTGYGTLDCLLTRGREDWRRLRESAQRFEVAGMGVMVACAADARALRHRFKEAER